MEITINTKENYIKSFDINCSPVEWLVISKSLKRLSQDKETHPNDRAKAMSMLATEPQFYEWDCI